MPITPFGALGKGVMMRAVLIVGLCAVLLSGCIIMPLGWGYHHRDGYRHHDGYQDRDDYRGHR